jgi:hypothetical protein
LTIFPPAVLLPTVKRGRSNSGRACRRRRHQISILDEFRRCSRSCFSIKTRGGWVAFAKAFAERTDGLRHRGHLLQRVKRKRPLRRGERERESERKKRSGVHSPHHVAAGDRKREQKEHGWQWHLHNCFSDFSLNVLGVFFIFAASRKHALKIKFVHLSTLEGDCRQIAAAVTVAATTK